MADAAGALAVRYGAVPVSPAAAGQAATDEEQEEYIGEEYGYGDGAAEESLDNESAGSAERMALRFGTAVSVETPRRGMKFV